MTRRFAAAFLVLTVLALGSGTRLLAHDAYRARNPTSDAEVTWKAHQHFAGGYRRGLDRPCGRSSPRSGYAHLRRPYRRGNNDFRLRRFCRTMITTG